MKNADMPAGVVVEEKWKGLTKREHFAAMAMQGICSNSKTHGDVEKGLDKIIARHSIAIADALLAELERTS